MPCAVVVEEVGVVVSSNGDDSWLNNDDISMGLSWTSRDCCEWCGGGEGEDADANGGCGACDLAALELLVAIFFFGARFYGVMTENETHPGD